MNTKEITTTFADFRKLQREAGIISPADEQHRLFVVLEPNGELEQVAKGGGDPYDTLERFMMKLALGKIDNIENAAALVLEAQVRARRVDENGHPMHLEDESTPEAEAAIALDATLTMGHDGGKPYITLRAAHSTDPSALPTDDQINSAEHGESGKLVEALEMCAIAVQVARQMAERKKGDTAD